MSQTLTVKLNQSEMKRLSKLAIRYGLSLPEFTRKDSFADYENAEDLKASFGRALADWRSGELVGLERKRLACFFPEH